jgi:hypothetical protein
VTFSNGQTATTLSDTTTIKAVSVGQLLTITCANSTGTSAAINEWGLGVTQ